MEHKRVIDLPDVKKIATNFAIEKSPSKTPPFTKIHNIFMTILNAHEYKLLGWFMSHSDGFLPTQTQGVKILKMDIRFFKKTLRSLIEKLDRHAEMVVSVSSDLKDFEGGVSNHLGGCEQVDTDTGGGCTGTPTKGVYDHPNKNNNKINKQDKKEKIYKKERKMLSTNPSPPTSGDVFTKEGDLLKEREDIRGKIIAHCNKNPQTIQQLVKTKELFILHLDYYLDYYLNVPLKKRAKQPYLQFLNSVRGDWGNIRRNYQPVKTFKEKHMEQMKSDFLANASESTKEYMRRVTEFNENRLKNAQGGKI